MIRLRNILNEMPGDAHPTFDDFLDNEDVVSVMRTNESVYALFGRNKPYDIRYMSNSDIERATRMHIDAMGPNENIGNMSGILYDHMAHNGSMDLLEDLEDKIEAYAVRHMSNHRDDGMMRDFLVNPNLPESLIEKFIVVVNDIGCRNAERLIRDLVAHQNASPTLADRMRRENARTEDSRPPHQNVVPELWGMIPPAAKDEVRRSIDESYDFVRYIVFNADDLTSRWEHDKPSFNRSNHYLFEDPTNVFSSSWAICSIFTGYLLNKNTTPQILDALSMTNDLNTNGTYKQLINKMINAHPGMAHVVNMDPEQRRAMRYSTSAQSIKQFIMGEV